MAERNSVEKVILRNAFYRDGYQKALLAFILLLCINVGLAGLILYRVANPVKPVYFPATNDGRIIQVDPLNLPAVTDSFVLQWSANAVLEAFNLDYLHWRGQLQQAANNFTPDGWHYFLSALQATNNLKTLINLKMVSDAQITGSPQIVTRAVIDGHYAWKITMPLLLSYESASHTPITMPMNITLIVVRMPVEQNPDRVAINNFFAESVNPQALSDDTGSM